MNIEYAKKLLLSTEIFFDADDFDENPETWNKYILNTNGDRCDPA